MSARLSTGVAGLDDITQGGLFRECAYMVTGGPGTGKTTLSLQFLTADPHESSLYVTLDKNLKKVQWIAESMGMNTRNLHLEDLSPLDVHEEIGNAFDIIPSSDLGLGRIFESICAAVERHKPKRVVIEPLSMLHGLAPDPYQFRRQCLALFNFIAEHGATLLFSGETNPAEAGQENLEFIADGYFKLTAMRQGRSLAVCKFRGSGFKNGLHYLRLTDAGMRVIPRLIPSEHYRKIPAEVLSFDIPELDTMLKGGLDRGTITIIAGPTGAGKTTLGMQFVSAEARRGHRSVVYTFEEEVESLVHRCERLGMPVAGMVEEGTLRLRSVEPILYAPDELALEMRDEVEKQGASTIMIDSTSGYVLAVENLSVSGENPVGRLHATCRYLVAMGINVILVNETPHITSQIVTPTDPHISYLSHTLIMLRFMEFESEVRKAIGVLKRRLGDFEKKLRSFEIMEDGIKVGPPLTGLRGILTGQPTMDEWGWRKDPDVDL
ncbi:gas vesicle protein GvpD [Marinobacteraceae bacterium S3BR75-40.1]